MRSASELTTYFLVEVLPVPLLYAIGIPGPAVALLVVTAFSSIVMLHIAAHDYSISAWRVLAKASHSLLLPLGICACACLAGVRVGTPEDWGVSQSWQVSVLLLTC